MPRFLFVAKGTVWPQGQAGFVEFREVHGLKCSQATASGALKIAEILSREDAG